MLRTIRPLAGEDLTNERVAKAHGFSLHAGVGCEAHQRALRERLCRYIARPAALVPRPRVNLTRYHGVLAPNHRWRAEVTPAGRGRGSRGAGQPERSAIERILAHVRERGAKVEPARGPLSTGPPVMA